jgi:hypothetical protein
VLHKMIFGDDLRTRFGILPTLLRQALTVLSPERLLHPSSRRHLPARQQLGPAYLGAYATLASAPAARQSLPLREHRSIERHGELSPSSRRRAEVMPGTPTPGMT